MTCPTLVCRGAALGEVGEHLRSVAGSAVRTTSALARTLVGSDAPAAQLVRFAIVGGSTTAVQVLLFTLLVPVGALGANVVAWAASSAMANELHRRRTFRAGERVGWLAAQIEGGGLSVVGLLATSAALALLAVALPGAALVQQTVLVLAITAAVGLARFVALRWSFVVRRARSV
jgi:putative flippase GtrA